MASATHLRRDVEVAVVPCNFKGVALVVHTLLDHEPMPLEVLAAAGDCSLEIVKAIRQAVATHEELSRGPAN